MIRTWRSKPDHPEAEKALAWIGALYDIDRRAEGDLARLAELRRTESARVLDALEDWLGNQITLTSLSIGKAAAYTLGNWPKLIRFVDDARIPLDTVATVDGQPVSEVFRAAIANHIERRRNDSAFQDSLKSRLARAQQLLVKKGR